LLLFFGHYNIWYKIGLEPYERSVASYGSLLGKRNLIA
jgi:hypothetical protein